MQLNMSTNKALVKKIESALSEPRTSSQLHEIIPEHDIRQINRHLTYMCWDLGLLLYSQGSKKYSLNPNCSNKEHK